MNVELLITKFACPYCGTHDGLKAVITDWSTENILKHSEAERFKCSSCENEIVVEAKIIVTVN